MAARAEALLVGVSSAIKVTHFGLESPGGFDFLEHLGGPVLQADAIGAFSKRATGTKYLINPSLV